MQQSRSLTWHLLTWVCCSTVKIPKGECFCPPKCTVFFCYESVFKHFGLLDICFSAFIGLHVCGLSSLGSFPLSKGCPCFVACCQTRASVPMSVTLKKSESSSSFVFVQIFYCSLCPRNGNLYFYLSSWPLAMRQNVIGNLNHYGWWCTLNSFAQFREHGVFVYTKLSFSLFVNEIDRFALPNDRFAL